MYIWCAFWAQGYVHKQTQAGPGWVAKISKKMLRGFFFFFAFAHGGGDPSVLDANYPPN